VGKQLLAIFQKSALALIKQMFYYEGKGGDADGHAPHFTL